MSDPQHEPTMEEILASIRKIISEDGSENPSAAAAPAAAPQASAPLPVEEPDVLELTQVVATHEPAPVPPPTPAPVPHDDIVFETVAPAPAYQPAPAADHSDIFSDHTRKAMDDAFAAIPDEEPAPAPQPAAPAAPIAPVDGATVETVFERAVRESFEPVLKAYLSDNSAAVIERMKPLIREWMDEHFPPLLEGAVRAEVERVVKARGAKR
jgi:cell pole-organizing protein PopZ